ncbi:MAG: zinc ribbon domain-containing protein [Planctomycetota bacterium]|jgi:hypothetical protein
MAERSSGLIAGLVVMAVLTSGTFSFMFAAGVECDSKKQLRDARELEIKGRAPIEGDESTRIVGLEQVKEKRQSELSAAKDKVKAADDDLQAAKDELAENQTWRDDAMKTADAAHSEIEPAIRTLNDRVQGRFREFRTILDAMNEARDAFESDEKTLREEIRIKNDELARTVQKCEKEEKDIDTEIGNLKAQLTELKARLKIVQTEAMRGKTISDASGSVIQVGGAGTNFVVVDLGTADRLRKGLKFQLWTPRRGYGMGWVRVRGRNFVKEGILPGDWLVTGRGEDTERYPIVNVGISKEAEKTGMGLAHSTGADTLKVLGPGVTEAFSVAGVEWRVERATEVLPPEQMGVFVKAVVEITKVRTHTSDAVILPLRQRNPVCPQCGWKAYAADMKNCPFCFLGDNNDEVQPLDATAAGIVGQSEDVFKPVMAGDRLSNPYFSPNRPLVFVLGKEPARQPREHMKAFIEFNGGRVVPSADLLARPEEADTDTAVHEVMPYEINYVIPGKGPDRDALQTRARGLGIRLMRENDLYEFFGAAQ